MKKTANANSRPGLVIPRGSLSNSHSTLPMINPFRAKLNVRPKRSQISMEYMIIIGFVSFVIIGILGVALVYSSSVRDRIKVNQATNSANKIIATAESVFYAGAPSKATIMIYFPEGISDLQITDNNLVFTIQTDSGESKIAFSSKVPISGALDKTHGLKKIQILAQADKIEISNL